MIKGILFNSDMVRAILGGRKTVTRRIVKPQPQGCFDVHEEPLFIHDADDGLGMRNPPYQPWDILYVRETFCSAYGGEKYFYLADKNTTREERRLLDYNDVKWRPSIHMPKEAARLWLKVTNVRVERLQEMTEDSAYEEGYQGICPYEHRVRCGDYESMCFAEGGDCENPLRLCEKSIPEGFGIEVWNKTIKKSDLDRYGWDANPLVWVIEFDRCEKPEGA